MKNSRALNQNNRARSSHSGTGNMRWQRKNFTTNEKSKVVIEINLKMSVFLVKFSIGNN